MIALNVISEGTKEKKKQLERMLKSVAPFVDGVFITFNQSMETADYFKEKFGAEISFFKWCDDFAAARNFALAQVPEKFDYVFWADTDDVVVNAAHLKELQGFDSYWMAYNYSIDRKTGEILIQHPRERLVRRDAYEWRGQLHETLIQKRKLKTVYIKNIWVNHLPEDKDVVAGFERNERILRKAMENEGGKDPRTLFYLGRTVFDLEKLEEAEKLFTDYLTKSGWDEERAMACNYLGDICVRQERLDEAVDWYLEAIKERPEFPLFFVNLGMVYSMKKDYDRAIHYTKLALKMEQPKTAMVLLPRDEKVKALETLYVCCVNQNKFKEALAAAERMLTLFPGDKQLEQRRDFVLKTLQLTEQGRVLVEWMKQINDEQKAALLFALPEDLADTQFVEKVKQQFLPAQVWPENSIVYFCGKGFEQWDETSLEKGVGGSETAVIHLTREWAKQGKTVVVYGDPKEEHEKDGVLWLPYWKWNMHDTFDTLVIWRNESVLNAPIKAKRVWLDLHDVPEVGEYTQERLKKVDKIFVKSPYHRSLLPDVPDEKFVIIPNGIDLSILPQSSNGIIDRVHKIVWGSSYDRGLEQALSIGWPIIKKALPSAEFHIFYGWNLFDTVHKHNPERQMWKKKIEELMKQDGVFHHGRVSQKELIKFKSQSVAHFYPSTFEEIDCISVRESAAVGCVPFTTDYAALKGRQYCVTTAGNPFTRETQENVAKNLVAAIKSLTIELHINNFKQIAREENWPNIANKWLEQAKEHEPVKKYDTAIFVEEFCETVKPIIGEVKTIYEIGSLDGDDARRMHKYFPESKVYVFEALTSNYEKYIRDDKELVSFNVAVSDRDGRATFYEKETNGIHSLHDRGGTGTAYEVETRRLDSLIEEHKLPQPEVVKIDVEGASYEVIEGFGKYIEGVKAVHIETEDYPYFKGEKLHNEVFALLEKKGFVCLQVNKNRVDENGHQYDSIWVRK